MVASTHASAEIRLADRALGAPTGIELVSARRSLGIEYPEWNTKNEQTFMSMSVKANKEKYQNTRHGTA